MDRTKKEKKKEKKTKNNYKSLTISILIKFNLNSYYTYRIWKKLPNATMFKDSK